MVATTSWVPGDYESHGGGKPRGTGGGRVAGFASDGRMEGSPSQLLFFVYLSFFSPFASSSKAQSKKGPSFSPPWFTTQELLMLKSGEPVDIYNTYTYIHYIYIYIHMNKNPFHRKFERFVPINCHQLSSEQYHSSIFEMVSTKMPTCLLIKTGSFKQISPGWPVSSKVPKNRTISPKPPRQPRTVPHARKQLKVQRPTRWFREGGWEGSNVPPGWCFFFSDLVPNPNI